MAYSVTLRFDDGVTQALSVAPDHCVLDAALEAGLPLVHQCKVGSCATCVGTVREGSLEMPQGRSIPLLAHEIAEGQSLLCIAQVTSDALIDLPYPSSLVFGEPPVAFTATIQDVESLAPTVARLVIKVPNGVKPKFQAGQYMRLKVPGTEEWRSYSMASTARDLPRVEFLIRLLPSGAMSDYLRDRAASGDKIEAEGPLGAFVLRDSREKHIFIAGGTGVAPMLSMIDTIRRGSGPRPDMLLAFGCTLQSQFFLQEDLELRRSWLPSLEVRYTANTLDGGTDCLSGTPLSAIGADDINKGRAIAYLCGPPAMIDAAREHLIHLGLDPGAIHAEKFVAS